MTATRTSTGPRASLRRQAVRFAGVEIVSTVARFAAMRSWIFRAR
ncbi:hypothetical protein [Intrasporangium sp.]|nr:hypothetical protein [Intrasporangium sp.]